MADPHRNSPLAHRTAIEAPGGVAALVERPHLGKIVLRADPDIAAAVVKKATGADLPLTPNTSSKMKSGSILWLGPDEWVLVTEAGEEEFLLDAQSRVLAGSHYQVVNVTDQHTVITLSGTRAREMLMKLTTLDLHPSQFKPGDVAGTMFGNAVATLYDGSKKGGMPVFDLIVRRSFAEYLWCILAEAGREFGLPEQEPKTGEAMRP